MFTLPSVTTVKTRVQENWKAALTVALISIPLSIALSIASGALTTVLFAATLTAPLGLGAAILPILALFTGAIVFIIWLLRLERYLYYIPSSVMYGFAAGVAILIAVGQLFDASGLSKLSRTGHLTGDIEKFFANTDLVHTPSLMTFV